MIITHECVIIIKKLHEIPYHTVNTWNMAHDKQEIGTSNLRRNSQPVAGRYVCPYNVHEIGCHMRCVGFMNDLLTLCSKL